MTRWFRFYEDAVNDPKVQRLEPKLFKAWVNMLCLASKYDGWLPSSGDVAFTLRVTEAEAGRLVDALVSSELLDEYDGRFTPHNWNGRQYKSDVSTERVKQHRKRKRNVSSGVSETPPDTDTDTDTDNRTEAKASDADASIDPSIAEREFFQRGRQVLGKNAGGQLAKLKTCKGHNVSLARAAIETAATKQNPAEYIAAVIRGPPARPLTAHQQERQTGREILDDLDAYIGRSGGEADPGILRHDTGDQPASIHGGVRGNLIDLSRAGEGEGSAPDRAGLACRLPQPS